MRHIKRGMVVLTTVMLMLSISMPAFAAEIEVGSANAEKFGLWTIVPPLVAIVLAFITKNVVISLFVGTLSGCFMLQIGGVNIIGALTQAFLDLVQRILNSLADPWNAGIILQVLAIGGVISLVSKMGGAKAIAEALAKRAKTPRSAQIVTWLLGLLVFFDDYANSLIVGPIMRPVADKLKISRERLAFIIDATAAPIAGLAIISTWIGLEVGLIKDSFKLIEMDVDAFGIFLETIPFRFYNILILVFVVVTSVMLREFGPMRKAEMNARKGINNISNIKNDEEENQIKEGVKLSIWNAIIPIGTLIVTALASFYYSGYSSIMASDKVAIIEVLNSAPFSFEAIQQTFSAADASTALFQSAVLASIVAIVMAVWKKIFTVTEAVDAWVDGMKGLLITGVILLLAWSLSSVIKDLGTAKYLVTLLSDAIPIFLLPSIIFLLGAVMSFATGTAYGTMGILMPLAIPLGYSVSPEMSYVIICTSAVLTGAIFGDHCSPISDTTILSSMGAGCDHIEHVRTQMWYSIFIAGITVFFGYIPAGFGVPIYIILPVAIIAIILAVRFIGKPIEENITEKVNELV